MITPSRIVRLVGLVGLAAFLGLAARTTTATPSPGFGEDETPPPPPIISRASMRDDTRPVFASRVDESSTPTDESESAPSPSDPPIAPDVDEIIPPHAPKGDDLPSLNDLPSLSGLPEVDSKGKDQEEKKDKPTKGSEPAKSETLEVIPAPLAPADADAPPIAPDLAGDDFPAVSPTIEPLDVDPDKAPRVVVEDPKPVPAPAVVERGGAWRAQPGDAAPQSARGRDVVVEFDEAPVIASNDPDAQARSFVERNQREAEERLKALESEADELRGRLTKIEAAIQQWRNLAEAMRQAQEPVDADAGTVEPEPEPEAPAEAADQPQASTALEAIPNSPRRSVVGSEPQSARAQDVPAPPLR